MPADQDRSAINAGSEKAAMHRRQRKPLDLRLMEIFGTDWCGNDAPPLTNRKIYVKDDGVHRVFSMQDDGGFVGIGYPDEWHVIMRTEAARAFALWTLWVWACDWFGLRSAIYYRALHHRVKGSWRLDYKRRGRWRKNVRLSSYDEWWAENRAETACAERPTEPRASGREDRT